jgi:hypothetical protein
LQLLASIHNIFNLQAGIGATMRIGLAAVVINSVIGVVAPPNQLPTDLLVPVELWERANGSTDEFAEMVDLTRHGGLPSRMQGVVLSVWE